MNAPEQLPDEQINEGIFEALHAYLERSAFWRDLESRHNRPACPDRDESLYHKPYTLDLTPNPALPPLEQGLQRELLRLIVEFGGIARDLDRLGSNENGDFLARFSDMWADAQTAAFSQATSGFDWGIS